MTDLDARIADAQQAIDQANAQLETLLTEACGPDHEYDERLNGLHLWCSHCRRTADGVLVPRSPEPLPGTLETWKPGREDRR